MSTVFADLKHAYANHAAYPIERIFQILPIAVIQDGLADQLMQRGSLRFSKGLVTNTGQSVDVDFGDRTVGRLTISFPQTMSAEVAASESEMAFHFRMTPVVVLFRDVDVKWKIASNQRLSSIVFTPTNVAYTLYEKQDPKKVIRLDFDLTLSPPKAQAALYGAYLLPVGFGQLQGDNDTYVGPFQCKCCGGQNNGKPGTSVYSLKAECITQAGNVVTVVYNFAAFQNLDGTPNRSFIGKTYTLGSFDECQSKVFSISIVITEITINRNLISGAVTTIVTGNAT